MLLLYTCLIVGFDNMPLSLFASPLSRSFRCLGCIVVTGVLVRDIMRSLAIPAAGPWGGLTTEYKWILPLTCPRLTCTIWPQLGCNPFPSAHVWGSASLWLSLFRKSWQPDDNSLREEEERSRWTNTAPTRPKPSPFTTSTRAVFSPPTSTCKKHTYTKLKIKSTSMRQFMSTFIIRVTWLDNLERLPSDVILGVRLVTSQPSPANFTIHSGAA